MEREGLNEQDAFARLRKASQLSGRPMRVVAEALIAWRRGDEVGVTFTALDGNSAPMVAEYVGNRAK